MRRRSREAEEAASFPPAHLRHFDVRDWPGKLPPEAAPPSVDCAVCAFYEALEEWAQRWQAANPLDALDPVACCPEWPDCGFVAPDDAFHQELI